MKILLTGSTGNLGSHTLKALLSAGHTVRCLVRPTSNRKGLQEHDHLSIIWGDLQNEDDVIKAAQGQDMIIHLGFLIPPAGLEQPDEAKKTNIGGMQALIKGAKQQVQTPRFFFASSYAVFGPEAAASGRLKADDQAVSTNAYTQQKLTCEKMLQDSGLSWLIYRFCDVVPLSAQQPNKLMYEIPLATPMEFMHPSDASLAIVRGIDRDDMWDRLWLVGGGKNCQTSYEHYLRRSLGMMGLRELPAEAFNQAGQWGTGWLDTSESQALLNYQHHTLDDIFADVESVTKPSATTKIITKIARPFIKRWLLSFSPYYRSSTVG